jgi:hypothetical protein
MLVSLDEMMRYMGQTRCTDSQRQAIIEILAGVQSELEVKLNRPVEVIHVRESLLSDSRGLVSPLAAPVWQVYNVTPETLPGLIPWYQYEVTPPALTADSVANRPTLDLLTGGAVNVTFFQNVRQGNQYFAGWPNQWVSMEYIGGYKGYTDEALKMAIKRVAARDIEPILDDNVGRKSTVTETAAASDKRPTGWQPAELANLKRLKRRVAV